MIDSNLDFAPYHEEPAKISVIEEIDIQTISAGLKHSACISREGKLFTWGNNANLELGIGRKFTQEIVYSPKIVSCLSHSICVDVSCSYERTAVITDMGELYVAGKMTGNLNGYFHLIQQDEFCTCVSAGKTIFATVSEPNLTKATHVLEQ